MPQAEETAALQEIFRITALRLDQRVDAPDRLKVHGRISTHVLDTCSGIPARGVKIELLELSDERRPPHRSRRAQTNHDGRTDTPLIGGQPVPIGRYELQFHIADYFAGAGTAAGRSAVPRRGAGPVLGRRAGRPLSRAAAGDALELLDLSRQLTAPSA